MEKVPRYDLMQFSQLKAQTWTVEGSLHPSIHPFVHPSIRIGSAWKRLSFSNVASKISTAPQWHIWQTLGRYVLSSSRHLETFMFIFYVLSFVHLFRTARLIAPIGALLHRRDNPLTDGDFQLLALPIKIWSNRNPIILQYSYVAGWLFFFSLSHTQLLPPHPQSMNI